MSLFETTQLPAANPKILKQIKGETLRDYQMFLDYCTHRDFNKLSKKYNLQVRQLFNIKEKNFWKQRMQNLEQQCSNAFLAENFSKLYKHNIQKRENFLLLSINLQDRLSKFMEDLATAPFSHEEDYQPTQFELIKSFRQQTRALIEVEKLNQLVEDQLKKFHIDITPEVLSNFERDVILSEQMLNYFEVDNSVIDPVETPEAPKNPVIEQFLPIKGGASSLAEGVCKPKLTDNSQNLSKIPTQTLDTDPVETPELTSIPLTQEEIELEKEIEFGIKEIQENIKKINENFKTMPNNTQPIRTNHKKQANNKLAKKIKSFAK